MKNKITLTPLFLILILSLGTSFAFSQEIVEVKKDSIANSLEEALKSPLDIKVIDLSKQKLKELPNVFEAFVNLEVLILDKNKLSALPRSIGYCENIKKISFASNKFTSFPGIICYLTHLEVLDFSTNEIDDLPDCLKDLIHLEELSMGGNEIAKIPDSLTKLNLKMIDMRMIQMNETEQYRIRAQFPETKIYFSKPCDCFGDDEEGDAEGDEERDQDGD